MMPEVGVGFKLIPAYNTLGMEQRNKNERAETGARILAFLGKGGAGKTALAGLTGRALVRELGARTLLIDADPAGGLCLALGRPGLATVAAAREGALRLAREEGPAGAEGILRTLDYLLLEALHEEEGFSLLAMGASEGPGCYCPVNVLVREALEKLSSGFDYIVIDAEAGLEQVNRQVTRQVGWPVIVSDSSRRGAATAVALSALLARSAQTPAAGVIFNRTPGPDPALVSILGEASLNVLGAIPFDPLLASYDREGRSLLDLPGDSPAPAALGPLLRQIGFLPPGQE
jgi:CO dehydrogenase maturation factor